MSGKNAILLKILVYLLLFSGAMLVFDSITLVIGVMMALFALHFFTAKWTRRSQR